MAGNRRTFHTFDSLRFFAFLKVFLLHLPILAIPGFNFIKTGGGIGVLFFFVLSGFLITYIILEEKQRNGTINLYHFISRRVLRIWPLYYFMILFAFLTPEILNLLSLTSSPDGYEPNWWMSILFLENYKMIATNSFPNVSPLRVMWSLCVEEHFYIIWGVSLYFIPIRKVPFLLVVSIVVANISRYIFYLNNWGFSDILTNIDYFAFGAIPAFLLINNENKVVEIVKSIPHFLKIAVILLTIFYVLLSAQISFPYKELIEPTIFGLLFCSVIFIILPEDSRIRISKNNILSVLGIFTYGLYLTHTIVINFLIKVFSQLNLPLTSFLNSILFIFCALLFTILASVVSYKIIEKPFLNLKRYFL